MSSAVDICNMALGYLGDEATVASLSPPEGSAQADHCARFYPIARDSLLEMHAWGFATWRAPLAQLAATPPSGWAYAYAQPANAINLLAVLAPDSSKDRKPQPYVSEVDAAGAPVIYSNQEGAVLHYTALVIDPTKFSPLFTEALAWLLASKLAGPLLKGDTGMKAAAACLQTFTKWLAQAKNSDASQQHRQIEHTASWMANR